MADTRTRRDRYQQLFTTIWDERVSNFDPHWRDLGDFLQPRRTRFWTGDKNRGDKRNQNIIDSTARFSARTLASGLHAGLTSPARPWMRLSTPDPEMNSNPAIKAWLHEVTSRMLQVFAMTNLYNTFPITYADMGVFGTAAVAILPDDKDLFRAYNYALGTYAVGLDKRGTVSTFCRETQLTVEQIVGEFGLQPNGEVDWTRISRRVRNAWDKGDYQDAVDVQWMVKRNEEYTTDRLESKYLPFSSCTWETGAQEGGFLREMGFTTFPIMVPRWDVTDGDSYGTDCPGMTALGDVKQLQIMQRRKGQAINKMVDPPLVGPSSLRTQKTSLLAGDITYQDVREGMAGLRSIHDVNLRIDHLGVDIGEVQYRIQRAFYEDLFLMLARSDAQRGSTPVTAREVEERHEEKLIALGPVLERTNDELLDPLVDRVYRMMETAGLIPEPPEELTGVNIRPEYISILAQAQKLVGVVGQDRFMQSVLSLAEVFPGVRHKIDTNETVDSYAELYGINPKLVRSNEDADALAQAEAEAAQAQAQAEAAKNMAGAVQAAGNTPMGGDTALSRVIEGAGEQV